MDKKALSIAKKYTDRQLDEVRNNAGGGTAIPGKDGKDGTSPVVLVSAIAGGHRITITDVNGTKTVDVLDGKDGSNGQNGKNGNGITSAVLNPDYTLTLTFDDGTYYTTPSIRGTAGKDGTDGYTPKKGVDYHDGEDGTSPVVSVEAIDGGHRITIVDVNGTKTVDVLDGSDGAAGRGIKTIARTSGSGAAGTTDTYTITYTDNTTSTFAVYNGKDGSSGSNGKDGKGISSVVLNDDYTLTINFDDGTKYTTPSIRGASGTDGVSPMVTVSKSGKVTTISIADKNGTKTATVNDGADGAAGERGSKILKITTASTSYTTTVGGFKPSYRFPLTNVLSESGSDDVMPGDVLWRSYYHYPVGYVDSSYVYVGAYIDIRGTTGKAGSNGKDGNGISSAVLNDDYTLTINFDDGTKYTTPSIRGAVGADGKTPEKYVDYFTAADQEEIVQQVITALGTPVFGRVDANNNIILTGSLAGGVYSLKYEDSEGGQIAIGSLNIEGPVTYTNVIPLAIDSDGSVFNSTGYIDGYRLSSNYNTSAPHYVSAQSGYFTTGFFPYTFEDCTNQIPFYVKGVDLETIADYARMAMYTDQTASYNSAHTANLNATGAAGFTISKLGELYYKIIPGSGLYNTGGGSNGWPTRNVTMARLSLPGSGDGVILTINEPIE